MSIINNICEHGHLERKCEVCELKAEISRLRGVCREAASAVRRVAYMNTDVYSALLLIESKKLADAGKEPSDGL